MMAQRGRPKKGKPTWNPARQLDVTNKRPGYRYRWCDKDAGNLQKKAAEGWVYASSITGHDAEHDHPGINGSPLTTVNDYREMVLMAIPEEIAQARDDYFQERTDKQTAGLRDRLQEDLDSGVEGRHRSSVHGKIVIE